MITGDLYQYAQENWSQYRASVTELSKNNKQKALVESDTELFNFDEICRALFPQDGLPASVDAIAFTEKEVTLIEFKTGFHRKTTKRSFPLEKCRCPEDNGKICKVYWELFFKEQKQEVDALISSVRLKAIESYLALEKKILPKCPPADQAMPIRYIVVIDEEAVDSMEDTLAVLSGQEAQDNHFSEIRRALKRLNHQSDANGNGYYYNNITVLSAQDFSILLRQATFSLP